MTSHVITGLVAAILAFGLGYKLASGECAQGQVKQAETIIETQGQALQAADAATVASNKDITEVGKREAATQARHQQETQKYEQHIQNRPGCDRDPGAFRMLNDAINRANGAESGGVPGVVPDGVRPDPEASGGDRGRVNSLGAIGSALGRDLPGPAQRLRGKTA